MVFLQFGILSMRMQVSFRSPGFSPYMGGKKREFRDWTKASFMRHEKEQSLKVKSDHHSKFSNSSNWKEEAWRKKIRALTDSNP